MWDCALGFVLFAVFLSAYALTAQERLFSDGQGLVAAVAMAEGLPEWLHLLYVWLGFWAQGLLPDARALEVLRGVSALAGAGLVASTYAWLRILHPGCRRETAFLGAAWVGATPCVWFFSTTVEVHTVHAFVALIALLFAWQLRRGWLWGVALWAWMPLLFLSHQSGLLLVPGFSALAFASARRRPGAGRTWPWLWALGTSTMAGAGVGIANWARGNPLFLPPSGAKFATEHFRGIQWETVVDGWLLGLLLLLPAAAFGVGHFLRPKEGFLLDRLAVLLCLLPVTVFFLWFGYPERGAYFAVVAPLYAGVALAAPLFARLRGLLFALVLGTAVISGWEVRRHDGVEWTELRARRLGAVRASFGTPTCALLVVDPRVPPVETESTAIRELALFPSILTHYQRGATPEDLLERWQVELDVLLSMPDVTVLLDGRFREVPQGALGPWIQGFERLLESHYKLTPVVGSTWPLQRVERRPTDPSPGGAGPSDG